MKQLTEPVKVADLVLDPKNPRLPENLQGGTQAAILSYLFEHDVLTELVDSYLANGFFPNEQLLVLPPDNDGKYVVVEGNRRLAALKYLLYDPTALEAGLPRHITDPEVPGAKLDSLRAVPAVELENREELSSYLGFRHISGLKTWSPEAKARYLYTEVENVRQKGESRPFYVVGRRVGSNALGVRNAYHAYNTLRVARDELDLRDLATTVLTTRFGVWTRLLGTANAAAFMGISDFGSDYGSVVESVNGMVVDRVKEVLQDLLPSGQGTKAVLQDSRDVTDYSAVLVCDPALEVLRKYGRLDLAAEIANGSGFDNRLTRLSESLTVGVREVADGVEVTRRSLELAREIERLATNLVALVKANADGDAGE